jgi:ParB family chromosome partitioning protein
MDTTLTNATEYRNLPLALLTESITNPRRIFDDAGIKELAKSIRTHGILSPLLVRPLNERSYEIVAGARRYRAAQLAEVDSAPVRIVNLSDAEALEAQLIENLQRKDVHPLEEAQGFRALLNLEEPKYFIEQIAARTGKSPAYIAQRLKLTDLAPVVVEAFSREEIGVGHALLLAKLQPDQQEQALAACFKEDWSAGGKKSKRILLPVRSLQFWIESNILLVLKLAPFDKRDGELVLAAGSCIDCPKRTGYNKLLFSDLGKLDACIDPTCYQSKVAAHVAQTLAAKPNLVKVSTAYGPQKEGSTTLPRNRYTEIRVEKPKDKDEAKRPEFKVCKFTTEAIVTDGTDVGTLCQVRSYPTCPVHHLQARTNGHAEERWKAEQEKQRRDQAMASATGLRVLAAIGTAVPVRLLKRDLASVLERLVTLLDENRIETLARQHGLRQKREGGGIAKAFAAHLRRADEGTLSRIIVEASILLVASRQDGTTVLRDAATLYKVDTDAIATKVKQEFAAKAKAKKEGKPVPKARKVA